MSFRKADGTTASLDISSLSDEEVAAALLRATQDKEAKVRAEEKARQRQQWEEEVRRPWSGEELFAFVKERALREFNIAFVVDDDNREVVRMFNRYFTGDATFCDLGDGFSLDKGLLLLGNVGTGKSTLMKLYARNKRQCYNMASCRQIARMYAEIGHSVFDVYRGPRYEPAGDARVFYQREIGYCFDDLGTENAKKHFGSEVNVMADVLQNRYDEGGRYPWTQTHITTNLTFDDIEFMYGTRVRDRIREMFNIICLDGKSRRK